MRLSLFDWQPKSNITRAFPALYVKEEKSQKSIQDKNWYKCGPCHILSQDKPIFWTNQLRDHLCIGEIY